MNYSRTIKNILAYYVGSTILSCSAEEQNVRLAHCVALGVAPRNPLLVHQLPGLVEVRHLASQVADLCAIPGEELEELRGTASWLFIRDALFWACETIRTRLWRHDVKALDEHRLYNDWGGVAMGLNMLVSQHVGNGIPFLNDGRVPNQADARALQLFLALASELSIQWEPTPALSIAAAWSDRRQQIQRSKAFSAFYAKEDVRGPYLARLKAKADARDRMQHPVAVELAVAQ
jgi:hypothetical protein